MKRLFRAVELRMCLVDFLFHAPLHQFGHALHLECVFLELVTLFLPLLANRNGSLHF